MTINRIVDPTAALRLFYRRTSTTQEMSKIIELCIRLILECAAGQAADFMRMRKCRGGGRVTLERTCYSRAVCPGGPVALVPSVRGDRQHSDNGMV